MDFINQMMAGMTVLAILSAVFNVSSNLPYTLQIYFDEQVRPSATTWIVWGTLDVVRALIQYDAGVFPFQMIGSTIGIAGILIVAALCKWKFVRLSIWDGVTLVGVALAMYLAFSYSDVVGPYIGLSGNNVALLASIVAVALGALPMYLKTIKNPYSEPAFPWVLVWLACVCNILNILVPNILKSDFTVTFENASFVGLSIPVAFASLTSILLLTIFFRRIAFGPKPVGMKVNYSGH